MLFFRATLANELSNISYANEAVFRGCATSQVVPCHNDEAQCNGANICVCDHKLCNDVCNDFTTTATDTTDDTTERTDTTNALDTSTTSTLDNITCYKCTSEDSWCLEEDDMKNKGDEAQTVCDSNYCLISGNIVINQIPAMNFV